MIGEGEAQQDDGGKRVDGDLHEPNHASLIGPTRRARAHHARAAVRTILDPLDRVSIEALAHFLAGLEERRELLGDRHLVAGARIAAGARLALLGREGAEAAQLDALAAGEGVGDLAEYGVDDVFDVALIEMRIAGRHALHELRLDHRTSPTRNDPEVSPRLHALKSRFTSIAINRRLGPMRGRTRVRP